MNFLLAIPPEVRLALLFLVGTAVGTQLNRGIYRLAIFRKRRIGPWSPAPDDAPPRRWFDFLPVFGWISLRREAKQHGGGFWIRPLLIELATGGAFAALYRWDLQNGPFDAIGLPPTAGMQHAQYLMQVVLVSLMMVATFIDFDEKTIPDAITVPGTLFALGLASLLPAARLPIGVPTRAAQTIEPLRLSSPLDWPAWLDGRDGLWCGLACYIAWCFAIMPFIWDTRRGLSFGVDLLYRSVFCRRASRPYHILAIVGAVAIVAVWRFGHWPDLLSALVGMAFGGGLIWGVRIVGTRALGVEAMGFGDVILMAMIGAFLGWQSALLIFFFAPFAALLIGVAQLIIHRRTDIAFGPYLCLAAVFLLVSWSGLWHEWAARIFILGWRIPLMVAAGLVLMGAMLVGWRFIKERFLFPDEPQPPIPNKPNKPKPSPKPSSPQGNFEKKKPGGKKSGKKGKKGKP
ncbi:MAG: A24 family peptidase [Pirellulaceae bacterium]